MQKYMVYVEKYVEWAALAIAGIFFLWMAWIYLAGAPVAQTMAGGPNGTITITPGSVDNFAVETVGTQLEAAMNSAKPFQMVVRNFAEDFARDMALDPAKAQLAQWQPRGLTLGTPLHVKLLGANVPEINTTVTKQDASLPKLEPGEVLGHSAGQTTVQVAAVAAPDAARLAPPANRADAAPAPGVEDRSWVSVGFAISKDDLVAAFDQAKVPAGFHTTAFLEVTLLRQELVNGQWSTAQPIKSLAIFADQPSFPTAGDKGMELQYSAWADKSQTQILIPPFYQWVSGDKWYAPGQTNPNDVKTPAPPRTVVQPPLPRPRPTVTPPRTPTRTPSRTPTRRPTRTTPNRGQAPAMVAPSAQAPAADDQPRVILAEYVQVAQARPVNPNPMFPPGFMPPGYPGAPAYPGTPGQPGGPGAALSGKDAEALLEGMSVPTGPFAPAQLSDDVECWAHDDTVQPEKTYRYAMVYKIRNPLFRTNLTKNPQDSEQFAIASPQSDWTKPITVRSLTFFYVSSGSTDGRNVRFDLYRWAGGKWHQFTQTVSPGDQIGVLNDGVDYTTGWTVVDIYPQDTRVVLSDESGELRVRDLRSDQNDPTYKDLQNKTYVPPATPAGGAAGTPPGTPPGANPGGRPGSPWGSGMFPPPPGR